jgi:hypothetical protein
LAGVTIFRLSKPKELGIVFLQQRFPNLQRSVSCSRDAWLRPIVQGGIVGVSEILSQIDREIAQLQRARALLNGGAQSTNGSTSAKKTRKKQRNLTPEGRKRIAEAVRRRWEKHRKAAAGK